MSYVLGSGVREFSLKRDAILFCVYLMFVRDVFGGPIRYYLDVTGFGPLWFAPDIFYAVACVYLIINYQASEVRLIWLTTLTFSAGTFGLLFTTNSIAFLAGIKWVSPLFFGILASSLMLDLIKKKYIHLFLWMCSVCGIIINYFFDFPWTGYSFLSLGVERVAGAAWSMDAEWRIAGFATDSHIGAFTVLIFCILVSQEISLLSRLILYVPSLCAIYLTTSRTGLAAFILFILLNLYVTLYPKGRICDAQYKIGRVNRNDIYVATFSFPVLAPLASVLFLSGYYITGLPTWLESYWIRASSSWVDPIRLMIELAPVSLVTGLGFGIAGAPSQWNEYTNYVLGCDNFILEIFVLSGIFGVVAFYAAAFANITKRREPSNILLATLLFYGTTIEGFGDMTFCFLVGASLFCVGPEAYVHRSRIITFAE